MYPKKELPFFIVFTAGLCSITALLALMTHRYPDKMSEIAKVVSHASYNLTTVSWSKLVLEFHSPRPYFRSLMSSNEIFLRSIFYLFLFL